MAQKNGQNPIGHRRNFRKKSSTFFSSKLFFDQKKNKNFRSDFFKVHLLVQENRFEAVPERFRQFRAKKTQGEKVISGN